MISHENRWLFLHPTRCAGKSIERALWGVTPRKGSSDHRTLQRYYSDYGPEVLSYFKFIFVRNPWARLVSIYSARQQIIRHPEFLRHDTFRSALLDGLFDKVRPQINWMLVENCPCVDFIGRVRSFDRDFRELCGRLGVQYDSVPHENRSTHEPYQSYYDDETQQLVARMFKQDIEFFGYEFREGT